MTWTVLRYKVSDGYSHDQTLTISQWRSMGLMPLSMEDNSSVHNSEVAWGARVRHALDIIKINWLAKSLDLNPIENRWWYLKHCLEPRGNRPGLRHEVRN